MLSTVCARIAIKNTVEVFGRIGLMPEKNNLQTIKRIGEARFCFER